MLGLLLEFGFGEANELVRAHAERLRELEQGRDARNDFAAFRLSDVVSVPRGLVAQGFL